MKLIGNYFSPYVRRVAIGLNSVGLKYELEELYVFQNSERVRKYNPVTRVPALVLDDGETIVESSAILDEIDELVGPTRALAPPNGKSRRRVIQMTALAMVCTEKARWSFYEKRFRPAGLVHHPWIEHNERQVLDGFAVLDGKLAKRDQDCWIADTETISRADITTAVGFTFANTVCSHLRLKPRFEFLGRFVERCEQLKCFRDAKLPETGPKRELDRLLSSTPSSDAL